MAANTCDLLGMARLATRRRLPRVHLLSDIHLETGPYAIPSDLEYDILVAAGDIGPVEEAIEWLAGIGKPVIYVLGNHEFYGADIDEALETARRAARGTQVHVLERQSVTVAGVRFLGATLWSSFGNGHPELIGDALKRMNDYREIRAERWFDVHANVDWFRRETARLKFRREYADAMIAKRQFHPLIAWQMHKRTAAWLERSLYSSYDGPTIVVTHHAPCFESLRQFGVDEGLLDPLTWDRRYRHDDMVRVAAYASPMEKLLLRRHQEIDCWAHGHLHAGIDAVVEGVRVVANPRGYAERPLDAESARAFALFGYPISEEEIAASQAHHAANPYEGNAIGFDRGLIIDLSQGFARPLARASVEPLEKMREELDDARQLAPLLKTTEGLTQECVERCLDQDIRNFRDALTAFRNKCGFGALYGLTLDTPPGEPCPPLAFTDEPVDPAAYDREIARMDAWRQWVIDMPTLTHRRLPEWLDQARRALDLFADLGLEAGVVPMSLELLRHAEHPEFVFYVDADEATLRVLGVHLDRAFNRGRIPRQILTWVRSLDRATTTERKRLLRRRHLPEAAGPAIDADIQPVDAGKKGLGTAHGFAD